ALDPASLALTGRLAALEEDRARLRATIEKVREQFIATRFAEARAAVTQAEKQTGFRGEPEVSRLLAELWVLAALCGDSGGFARAAATHPELRLDPARWSPDARAGYERAQKERERGARARLVLGGDGAWFVDGIRAAGAEVELPRGTHQVYALLPGR